MRDCLQPFGDVRLRTVNIVTVSSGFFAAMLAFHKIFAYFFDNLEWRFSVWLRPHYSDGSSSHILHIALGINLTYMQFFLRMLFVCTASDLQCFDAVGWAAGRASGL